jgi:predicted S18 family serine protease
MKYIKSLLAIIAFFTISSVSAQSITEKWKQLNDYHELLSKTFHPAEEGNFDAIKNSSEELVVKAEALDLKTMPQELRTSQLDETIAVLKKQTKTVNDLVQKKAPNAEILRAFQNLHDVFHRIVEICQPRK